MGKRNFMPVEPRPDWPDWISLRCMGKKCGERAAASYGSIYGVSPHCGCDQFIRGTAAFYAVEPTAPVRASTPPAAEEPAPPIPSREEMERVLQEKIESMIRPVIKETVERVLNEVAWEVIPEVAESLVRRRMKELEEEAATEEGASLH